MNPQLRSLVRKFIDGEIAYSVFRGRFVVEYLSVLHHDLDTESDVNAIENSCADFDEQDISADELKAELRFIANRPTVSVQINALSQQQIRSSSAFYCVELVA